MFKSHSAKRHGSNNAFISQLFFANWKISRLTRFIYVAVKLKFAHSPCMLWSTTYNSWQGNYVGQVCPAIVINSISGGTKRREEKEKRARDGESKERMKEGEERAFAFDTKILRRIVYRCLLSGLIHRFPWLQLLLAKWYYLEMQERRENKLLQCMPNLRVKGRRKSRSKISWRSR